MTTPFPTRRSSDLVIHRLVPTPERLVLWVIVTLMALPFFAAFETLVRRGGTWGALGWSLLGRAVLLLTLVIGLGAGVLPPVIGRSEEHTSELQSLMRISYAVFCLKKKTKKN